MAEECLFIQDVCWTWYVIGCFCCNEEFLFGGISCGPTCSPSETRPQTPATISHIWGTFLNELFLHMLDLFSQSQRSWQWCTPPIHHTQRRMRRWWRERCRDSRLALGTHGSQSWLAWGEHHPLCFIKKSVCLAVSLQRDVTSLHVLGAGKVEWKQSFHVSKCSGDEDGRQVLGGPALALAFLHSLSIFCGLLRLVCYLWLVLTWHQATSGVLILLQAAVNKTHQINQHSWCFYVCMYMYVYLWR